MTKENRAEETHLINTAPNNSPQKKPSKMDTFNELYTSVVGTGVAVDGWFTPGGLNDYQGLIQNTLSGLIWNLLSTAGIALKASELYRKARESAISTTAKSRIAQISSCYFMIILPAATLWGFMTVAQSAHKKGIKNVLLISDQTLGNANALAASNFSYAGGLLIDEAILLYSFLRAKQKSDPLKLLEDRFKKYTAAVTNTNISTEKTTRLLNETKIMFIYCNVNNLVIRDEIKNNDLFKNVAILKKNESSNDAENLIAKQDDKIKKLIKDMIGIAACFLGATLGGFSMLIYPRALLGASVICYVIMSAIKLYQLTFTYCFKADNKPTLSQDTVAIAVDNEVERPKTPSQIVRKRISELLGLPHARSASTLNDDAEEQKKRGVELHYGGAKSTL